MYLKIYFQNLYCEHSVINTHLLPVCCPHGEKAIPYFLHSYVWLCDKHVDNKINWMGYYERGWIFLHHTFFQLQKVDMMTGG